MIDEKKINIGNIILLLKHIGYCKTLKRTSNSNFEHSSLGKRFEEMIVEEYKKKEERDERLLADLCECYLLLNGRVSLELLSICASCILKVALNKEENEKVQKEVEMALLASNCFGYHSAWKFLIDRLLNDRYLEEVFVNELHFVREARSELDELSKCIDWKAKEEGGGRKEKKEMDIILGWLQILEFFFSLCQLWNEEFAELVSSIVQVFRAAKDNYGEINDQCVHLLILTEDKRGVKDLLNGGAVDAFMEEIIQSTLKDGREER
ncbi:uncharacterized protein MONOS_13196 [Monocercomonoides exilis]|uniref:uncharacterized protein n=1 Tax=Monocercomonoides exilis TaxID=2049356 RepID=UPI0035598DF1|nr:hypothetical protein MONOS_13196 [Monocercomonoides exilis]|eukprot:MONOS_13196.1-p1 / transcript=MONOS_13196.1 / gene=MONOS_13196 / organism=Monocercomonoides_exilis_PA203 / gene_product=unspecified product / transcript_product=unspecified product / location=Mono_scaffold00789:11822-12801(+) / protein_length=266 / sequence_SO=supercontig / SO=protein_coding / is_pseudo=false